MSDMLSIGASGLRAYQVALNTVSENIANSGATGYTRRTTGISEVVVTGGATAGRVNNGMGSVVTGVVRQSDEAQAAAVRSAGADLAKTESSVTWLGRIESTLNGSQLGTRLSSFFNAATQLAADPTSMAARSTMLETAGGVADAFTATGASLDQIATDVDTMGKDSATALTNAAAALAKVNDGLARARPQTAGQATLLDQRDQLLEQMSALTDVSVSYDDLGRATVRGGGAAGPLLVNGYDAANVSYTRNGNGSVQFSVLNGITQQVLSPNGGALAGIVEGAQKVADAQSQLGTIAQNFTSGVNAVQAQGRDLNGNAGAPIFAVATDATAHVSSVLTDPSAIAAAAVGGGARDNTNLTALATLRSSAGYEAAIVDMTTTNAATLAQRKTVADAQTAIHDNAVATRDSLSGVSMDSEAVDLMRFQQAYSASSRVIQIARDTLQSILDIR